MLILIVEFDRRTRMKANGFILKNAAIADSNEDSNGSNTMVRISEKER